MLDNLALAVVTVTRLDRLVRSTRDLLKTVAAITEKKAGFRCG
jgi:DNA invertase Pin-like site-specific DNA recombinase